MKKSPLIITTFILISVNVTPASANQQSIDRDLFETSKKITDRSENHQERVTQLVVKRRAFGKSLKEKHKELSKLPETDATAGGHQRRSTLQLEILKLASQYVKVSYDILFSVEELLSANLTDIVKLTNSLQNPGLSDADSKNPYAKLKNVLKELGDSIKQNPRFNEDDLNMPFQQDLLEPEVTSKFLDFKSSNSRVSPKILRERTNGTARQIATLNKSKKRLLSLLIELRSVKEKLRIIKDGINRLFWIFLRGCPLEKWVKGGAMEREKLMRTCMATLNEDV